MTPKISCGLESPTPPLSTEQYSHRDSGLTNHEPVLAVTGSSESEFPGNITPEQAFASEALNRAEGETSQTPAANQNDVPSGTHVQHEKKTNIPPKIRLFGIGREQNSQGYVPQDDYNKKYPPDEFGQEMGPSARVWRVYLDEAELFDRDMVEGWKDGIDVLLVFAGLFSAVITTFVAQTSQKLDNDYGRVSASLLTELIAIQRAIATSNPLDQIPPSEFTFFSPPRYTKGDVWVNGLWFASLTLSLSTALFAVLIKQWIQHYTSFISGSALERARIHQFRYSGLDRWGVRAIIGVLPLLLYMALFMFFLGLAIFVHGLRSEIAYMVTAIGGTTFVLYVVTNGLPVFYPQCPYRTPLIEHIYTTLSFGLFSLRRLLLILIYLPSSCISDFTGNWTVFDDIERWCRGLLNTKPPGFQPTAMKASESKAASSGHDEMIQKIIEWLLTVSSNPSVKPIALQSISGLHVRFSRINEMLGKGCLVRSELVDEFKRHQSSARSLGDSPSTLVDSAQFYDTERIVRASIFAPTYGRRWDVLSRFPRPIVWEPHSWKDFDTLISKTEHNRPFLQALATYRVTSIRTYSSDAANAVLQSLSPLANSSSAQQYLGAFKAWSQTLVRHLEDSHAEINISTVYSGIRPLFQVMLEPGRSSEIWPDLLSTLCHLLPQSLVEESFGTSPDRFKISPETLPSIFIKCRALLLSCLISEWDASTDLGQVLAREEVVSDSCQRLYKAVKSYRGNDATVIPKLAAILDKFVSHEGYAQSSWEEKTYQALFDAYFGTFVHKSAPLPTSDLSSDRHFHKVLESTDWVKRHLNDLFDLDRDKLRPSALKLASQTAGALRGQDGLENGPRIKSAFDALMDINLVTRYLTSKLFNSRYDEQWPSHMQPFMRWALDYVVDHGESALNYHPSIHTFATKLVEREGFLAFICSSFLVEWSPLWGREVVFSEESSVLVRLADYHKDKSGAIDAWHRFLSWAKERSSDIHNEPQCYESWLRADFDKYARMADCTDRLAITIGLEDPGLRLPRFEEEYIVKFLNENGRPLHTSSPDAHTQVAGSSSANHQNIVAVTNIQASGDADSQVRYHGTPNMA